MNPLFIRQNLNFRDTMKAKFVVVPMLLHLRKDPGWKCGPDNGYPQYGLS
jgi:hypothetical protein